MLKRSFFNIEGLVVLLFFLTSNFSYASEMILDNLSEITSQPRYSNAQWWIEVKDLHNEKTLFKKNSGYMLMPASVTKMFITAAALHKLGYDYRFKTPVYFKGERKGNILVGDLILVGQGDLTFGTRTNNDSLTYGYIDHIYANNLPGASITPENPLQAFDSLAKQIKNSGVNEIRGNILVDDRLFKQEVHRNYLLSPVMVNENLFDIEVIPGTIGEQAIISWRPQVSGVSLENHVKTVKEGEQSDVTVTMSRDNKSLIVRGKISSNDEPLLRVFPVKNPKKLARQALIDALKKQGINVIISNAETSFLSLPTAKSYNNMALVAEYTSPPLSEYVKIILKLSHNIGADLIPYLLASNDNEKSFEEGMGVIAKYLTSVVGLNRNTFVFGDGAGGDSNRLLPEAAISLLTHMYNLPEKKFKAFFDALPILGIDGSIKKAAKNIAAVGKIHAKTGTSLSYDVANKRFYSFSEVLSGYIEAKNGHMLAFIVAVSNTPLKDINEAFIIQKDVSKVAVEIYNHSDYQIH